MAERQRSALNGPNTEPSASEATVEAANGTTGGDGERRHEDTISKSRFTSITATTERRSGPRVPRQLVISPQRSITA